MSKKVTVEMPDALYQTVEQLASAAGKSPGEMIVDQLAHHLDLAGGSNGNLSGNGAHPEIQMILHQIAIQKGITDDEILAQWKTRFGLKGRATPTDGARKTALDQLRRFAGAINSGDPHSADNERIEAELAAEYANSHRKES